MVVGISEAAEIAQQFVGGINRYDKLIGNLRKEQKSKIPFTVKLAKWLVKGNEDYASKLNTVEEDFTPS